MVKMKMEEEEEQDETAEQFGKKLQNKTGMRLQNNMERYNKTRLE